MGHHVSVAIHSRRRQIALATAVLALATGAFVLGRSTAPDEASKTTGQKCTEPGLARISMPDSLATPEGLAWFSLCEQQEARMDPLGNAAEPLQIYATADGIDVIAWWYTDCGSPEGIVAVGAERPNNCGSTDTTSDTMP
jgi:hypothetical protein